VSDFEVFKSVYAEDVLGESVLGNTARNLIKARIPLLRFIVDFVQVVQVIRKLYNKSTTD